MSVELPYDFQCFSEAGTIAAERKTIDDLIASVADGRLGRECAAMAGAQIRVLICEGMFAYTPSGRLILGGKPSRWSRQGVRNLLRSVKYKHGLDIEYTSDIEDTVGVVKELYVYFNDHQHTSLYQRPSLKGAWGPPVWDEQYIYWLQGLPSIKIGRASLIAKKMTMPEHLVKASYEEWLSVPGIGEKTADEIFRFLHPGWVKPVKTKKRKNAHSSDIF